MSNNAVMGEEHTPSKSLDNVGLLIWRKGRSGAELLVRSKPLDRIPTYSIAYRKPMLGETALECAQRVARLALGFDLPATELDYRNSAVIDNVGMSVQIRVFILELTPGAPTTRFVDEIVVKPLWRRWRYDFMPLTRLDRVWLHLDIGATVGSLRELLKPT